METETVNIDGVLKSVQKKLGETYQFIRHLGGGEFSNVYLVRHKASGKDYALKILDYHYLLQRLKKEDLPDAQRKFNEIKKRFITEARLYKKIHHPNIVNIHHAGVIEEESKGIEIPYIITPYIQGASLAEVIKREAPLEIGRVIHISQNVLHALEKIYQNRIIHRDLKPANIMVEEATGEAIIIDFGIAKEIIGGTRLTTTGALLGSPMYIAPEQTVDSSSVGPATDIYSFGVVLYEMLTGEPPFKGHNFLEILNAHREKPIPNVKDRNPALPSKMKDVIYKSMAKNPQERYQQPMDLLKDLIDAIEEPEEPEKAPGKIAWFKRYYIYLFSLVIIGIALAVLLDPFSGKKRSGMGIITPFVKLKPEDFSRPEATPAIIAKQKLQEMRQDYEILQGVINGQASQGEKIAKCQTFLNHYRSLNLEDAGEKEKTLIEADIQKKVAQFKYELEVDSLYDNVISTAKTYIETQQYDSALDALNKAGEIKDTDEVKQLLEETRQKKETFDKQNGETRYQAAKDKINLASFLEFEKNYPLSIHIPDLKERLKNTDKRLPPEDYWDSLQKNGKGYYETVYSKAGNEHLMIYIPEKRIWIDKYEVSNRQYRAFLSAEHAGLPPRKESQFIHSGDRYPAVVSYEEAETYCRKHGFRLPTIAEWEYAAGRGVYTYPWGNEAPGQNGAWPANLDSLGEEGKEERDGYTGTAPVDSFSAFSSPYGLVNMAGNVWEWVQGRILKGGSFLSGEDELMIKNDITGSRDDTQGFRCVKEERENNP